MLRGSLEETPTPRDVEIAALEALPTPTHFDMLPGSGVLLSDRIEHYVHAFKMIDPFYSDRLKPAAYELSVGSQYSIGGKTYRLTSNVGDHLTIKPFEVAIIQTRERLNIPEFLIARWNIKVSLAYDGLMWVGGPQVDAGWSGFLCCPIYNLSQEPVTLHYDDRIAVIDFITTTKPNEESRKNRYKRPRNRQRITFDEYRPNRLQSALATKAESEIKRFGNELEDVQRRVEKYTGTTFGALAILVAALAVVASTTKTTPPPVDIWTLIGALFITGMCFSFMYIYARATKVPDLIGGAMANPFVGPATFVIATLLCCFVFGILIFQLPLERQIYQLQGQAQSADAKLITTRSELSAIKIKLHIK